MRSENPYSNGELIDALRISDADWLECVEEMDYRASHYEGEVDENRTLPRHRYRNIARIFVIFRSPDGQPQQFKVRAYNLSEKGLGFLHGAYIYKDTPAEIYMQHHINGMTRISARIVHCELVKKRIHQVGAEFDKPIDLSDYLLTDEA